VLRGGRINISERRLLRTMETEELRGMARSRCVVCTRARRMRYVLGEQCRLIVRLTMSTVSCPSAACARQCSGFYGLLLPSLEHERLNLVRA